MPTQQKQNFILSYAVDLLKIQVTMCTLVSGVDECLVEFIRSFDLYQKVHKINSETNAILNDMREIFGHRQTDEVHWVDETKLTITDFESIDDQQLDDIRKVKALLGVVCLSQDVALRRFKHDLSLAKSHNGMDEIKHLFNSDLEFCFTPVEKAVIDLIITFVENDKDVDIGAIRDEIQAHNAESKA